MSFNTIFIIIDIIIFIATWFIKAHLFEKDNNFVRINDKFESFFIKVKYPVWEMLLVLIVCSIPVVNICAFILQMFYITLIDNKNYKFSIINIHNIHNDEISLNKCKEQWKNNNKFKYKIFKFIKKIFSFNLV